MTKQDLFAQGLAKVKENDNHAAVELFSKVLKEDPNDTNALSQRAVCYMNIEKYELSMADINRAVELDPEYSFYYQCRGYIKARIKDYEGSLEDYQKAVDLDPKDSIAYNNLALAQEQMGWAGKAKENFEKSDKLAGIKTAEERSNERVKQAEADAAKKAEPEEENAKDKVTIATSVFTKKNSFREFIRFIGNGFKLKDNDKS